MQQNYFRIKVFINELIAKYRKKQTCLLAETKVILTCLIRSSTQLGWIWDNKCKKRLAIREIEYLQLGILKPWVDIGEAGQLLKIDRVENLSLKFEPQLFPFDLKNTKLSPLECIECENSSNLSDYAENNWRVKFGIPKEGFFHWGSANPISKRECERFISTMWCSA